MTEYKEGWRPIKFGASPELYKKLEAMKGRQRWWQFFRDHFEGIE